MKLRTIYNKLTKINNYKPSQRINFLFNQLVSQAIQFGSVEEFTQEEIETLQKISAKAEYELELFWAKQIIFSENPIEMLNNFPYLKNYQDLTKLELSNLKNCLLHDEHNYLFIGGGPLPMTAILLAKEYDLTVTILDNNKQACALSQKLIQLLNLQNKISIINKDGEIYNYCKHNVIYIAALAGTNSESKQKIFNKIKKTAPDNAHILARTSWRNRKLLYKPLDDYVYEFFKPIIKVDPYTEIVNSFVIFRNDKN
jgi:nicotianamine synthase